ncbi:NAD(+) hydrolase SARM1-like [Babylonia areolata]|uniref:NAD(+) hydrolase SARM1-like n=1 Tax=Babylonia areolata TaxID=304850 RepID=UPI003FD5D2BA
MAQAATDTGVDVELGPPDEDGDLDSLSSMHRIRSEATISSSEDDTGGHRTQDFLCCSTTGMSRSKSDAVLLQDPEDDFPGLGRAGATAAGGGRGVGDSGLHNVSECSRVYLDLSRAEPFERVEFVESTVTMFRSSSGRQLETIPQDEELQTVDLSHLYASQRSSLTNGSCSSSLEDLSAPSQRTRSTKPTSSSSSTSFSQDTQRSKASLTPSLQAFSLSLKQSVRTLQMGSIPEQVQALEELNVLMDQAWSTPVTGRDLACNLCDVLRTEGAVDLVVGNLSSAHRELLMASARLLDQCLTTPNRNHVARTGLEGVVRMTRKHQGDVELAVPSTGILESLFKTSEESCSRVVGLGGLHVIVFWCRCQDPAILRHCAIALSNLALYGGPDNQHEMIAHKAPEWLFPLAFVEDEVTRYYACLAMAVLASNPEVEPRVRQSGTLDLVLPFLRSHDPSRFTHVDATHAQGRSSDWLRRLTPLLRSSRKEARALAAFTMAMEAGIKVEQDRKEVLYDVGAVEGLRWLASNPRSVATRLAAQALSILGEEVPHKLSRQVPLWSVDNVLQWVTQVGFGGYVEGFRTCQVDGDLLLRLTDTELMENVTMGCALTRKRFLRELKKLKMAADYSSCDPTKVSDWLGEAGWEMTQYSYQMLQAGVDRRTLMSLTEPLLMNECAIHNGIHRQKILSRIEEHRVRGSRPSSAQSRESLCSDVTGRRGREPIDVFLSYRRSNGSQLASLLKVHLQLRGFSVFIDIERLLAGKFDEGLLQSVRQASHLVLVLTPNALDRCVGDDLREDWVHKEIATAMEAGVNIIPVTADGFQWPPTPSLPADISRLPFFNGLRWIHDYQDACVDKLEAFLRGQTPHHLPSASTLPPTSADPLLVTCAPLASAEDAGRSDDGDDNNDDDNDDNDGDDDDDDDDDAILGFGEAGPSPMGSCVDVGGGGGGGKRRSGALGCGRGGGGGGDGETGGAQSS